MRAFFLLAVASSVLGCSGHYALEMREPHQLARSGQTADALTALHQKTDGAGWDELLVALDDGALLHRMGKWKESADALNRAIAIADERETVSVSEELVGRAPFRMANHEKQSLHALQALNYVQLGKLDDALVEARLTDLRQAKLGTETGASARSENFVTGSTVDETQRTYFEQLRFGRYLSALAWELSGKPEEAFIDYARTWELSAAAPPDAPSGVGVFAGTTLRLAKDLGRKELPSLEAKATTPPDPPLGTDGAVVVIVEAGFSPELALDERNQSYSLRAVARGSTPGSVVANGTPVVPETSSSIEDLAERRQFRGILIDRERSASVGVNTLMAVGGIILFPIGIPLLIKRGWESAIRLGQSWLMLPREFQVARLRLKAGRHTLQVPSLQGLVSREVEVHPGQTTVLVTQGP